MLARTPDDITPDWLTQVLRASGALRAARVTEVAARPVGTGQMGTSIRCVLTCDDNEPQAPPSVVVKLASADPTSRATGLALRSYEAEVRFYRDIASSVDVRTPHCHFAEIDLATGEFTLVLEDMTPCRQGDQLAGCRVDQAALALEELAKLHTPRWGDASLAGIDWLDRNTPEALASSGGFLPMLLPGFLDRYAARLPADVVGAAEALMGNLPRWLSSREPPFAVQHGDYRLDNMLFGDATSPCPLAIVDWQTVILGPPVADASYFLGASLTVEDRRRHERELLELYHRALCARGVQGFSWDRCWSDYRRYAFGGLLMAIAASMLVVQTERGDEMFLAMASRHGAQIVDLEATELL